MRLLFLKGNSKILLILYFLFSFFIFDISKAEINNLTNSKNNQIETEYLESRKELEEYIIDTGDSLSLEFFPADEFSGIFTVNEEGELLLPEIDETYVRGLTITELRKLLNKKYSQFLIEPEIKVRIAVFKSIRVLVSGELRNPGFYKFPAYESGSFLTFDKGNNSEIDLFNGDNNKQLEFDKNSNLYKQSSEKTVIKRSNENITTLSNVIKKAGGITSLTDLSRIEIIRDVPLSKGGGKKRAIIDFNSYINESNPVNDIRIFDGDRLFFPMLSKSNPNQIPKSILSGITPKFISVNLFGRVDNPGTVKLPIEATLSDAIDVSGPIKPLSGKIILIRYNKDGTILKKNISYSSSAKKGSKRNPYLQENDLISVKNSVLSKATGIIREVTEPFVGIYSTKQLIEGFNN